jgi:hypothetical protein
MLVDQLLLLGRQVIIEVPPELFDRFGAGDQGTTLSFMWDFVSSPSRSA